MTTIILTEQQIYSGNLIVVNANYPLVCCQQQPLRAINELHSNILLAHNAATILNHLFQHLHCQENIVPVSGYRSFAQQKDIYADSLTNNGREFTEQYVAMPNHSEHQTGLAIDLGLQKEVIDFIRPDFPYQGICNKFRQIAPQYGFIERYQKGKEQITGIAHEPWHFRFVGYPHAQIISQQQLSLEEYIMLIKKYRYRQNHWHMTCNSQQVEISYLPYLAPQTMINLSNQNIHQISGNNIDGFIITQWRSLR